MCFVFVFLIIHILHVFFRKKKTKTKGFQDRTSAFSHVYILGDVNIETEKKSVCNEGSCHKYTSARTVGFRLEYFVQCSSLTYMWDVWA